MPGANLNRKSTDDLADKVTVRQRALQHNTVQSERKTEAVDTGEVMNV